MYIDKLDNIVIECKKACHRTIKIKQVAVNSRKYIDFEVKYNDKNSKFEVGGHMRTSKYKNIFAN